MANLVQLSNELEYVPKEQLAAMAQDPNSRFPTYLVLSEIQRRTANEKAYAASQQRPTTTIAEEVVSDFMQPKGLQAGMPSESAPTDAFSSDPMGMPASAPMQQPMMMASGGLTGYAAGGNPLQTSFQGISSKLSNVGSGIADRYTDEEGLDYSNIFSDLGSAALFASMFTPVGALRAAGMAGLRGLGAINPFSAAARTNALRGLGRQTARAFPSTVRDKSGRFLSQRDIGRMALGRVTRPLGALTGIGILQAGTMDEPMESDEQQKSEMTQAQKDYLELLQQNQLAAMQTEEPRKGLGAMSSTDLIQLGGAFMGSRNLAELGQNVAGLAAASADRRAAASEAEINKRLLEAQIGKLETETSLLPDRQLSDAIEGVTDAIKQAEEGGADEERIAELRQYLQFLVQQQAIARGYNPQAMSGSNQNLISQFT